MAGTLPMTAGSAAQAAASAAGRKRLWLVAGGGGALALFVGGFGLWFLMTRASAPASDLGETARALRDRLLVSITESGELDAKRSTDVRCEVEGQSNIVWVIEEGSVVKEGDKLAELDSADLRDRLRTQEMTYKTALSTYNKADQAYRIQESTRQSLLSAAALKVKFALLDLKKYLGTDLADRLIASEGKMPFDTLVKDAALGGDALQQKRKLQSDIDLAGEELSRAASKVEWTRTLKEKGYVTGSELEADELAYKRQQVALDQAKTALDLFLRYEFPKAAEKAYTDWMESKREYDRVDARTNSELASAKSDLDNRKDSLALEETHLKKFQEQLAKCTITAPQPGMVVYDATGGRFDRIITIEPGAAVRHQQNLFKLPDMSEMVVRVKLHESVVKQAVEGAQAFITIDAYPTERLTGKITKIAIMPDRSQSWMNPTLKTYVTEITLDATPPGFKPGMNAQVEIFVAERPNALQVPISAVFVDKGFQVAYVKTSLGTETRRVEAGLSNDRVVEIVKGIREGEEVYLYKPVGVEELKVSEEEQKAQQRLEQKMAEAAEAAKAAKPASEPGPEEPSADKAKAPKRPRESGGPGPRNDKPPAGPAGDRGPRPPAGRDDAPGPKPPGPVGTPTGKQP